MTHTLSVTERRESSAEDIHEQSRALMCNNSRARAAQHQAETLPGTPAQRLCSNHPLNGECSWEKHKRNFRNGSFWFVSVTNSSAFL